MTVYCCWSVQILAQNLAKNSKQCDSPPKDRISDTTVSTSPLAQLCIHSYHAIPLSTTITFSFLLRQQILYHLILPLFSLSCQYLRLQLSRFCLLNFPQHFAHTPPLLRILLHDYCHCNFSDILLIQLSTPFVETPYICHDLFTRAQESRILGRLQW